MLAYRYFGRLRSLSGNRLTGLDWLSTALWHLQREVDLSVLSQELLREPENKKRPETWIVLGNCFSLQKEHEHAIKFFKRAIQVLAIGVVHN
jgi:anaphase-promoting complex subunit 3